MYRAFSSEARSEPYETYGERALELEDARGAKLSSKTEFFNEREVRCTIFLCKILQ